MMYAPNWIPALINITVAAMIFWSLLPPYAHRIRWLERIGLAGASASFAMTAAFQVGAWSPREWSDIVLNFHTMIATVYLAVNLFLRWRCRQNRRRLSVRAHRQPPDCNC